MLDFLDVLRSTELQWWSVLLRLVLAMLLGGFIGIERERKGRAAGFRTHILICLGAAMTTLTSQYIIFELGQSADPSRMGAQVIAGLGFIGAGTVIVIKRRQIKGITTAAGIWTAGIVGLCCGSGFYEGAVVAAILVLLVEVVFAKLEEWLISKHTLLNVCVEYSDSGKLGEIVDAVKRGGSSILGLEVRNGDGEDIKHCAVFSLRLPRKHTYENLSASLFKIKGVTSVQEL